MTGGARFIGSNFVRYLLDTDPDSEVTDPSDSGRLSMVGSGSNYRKVVYSNPVEATVSYMVEVWPIPDDEA